MNRRIPMMLWMMVAQRLLLTLALNKTSGFAPLMTTAHITVDDNIRGGVCLVWSSEDADTGQSCWNAEQKGRTVWQNITLRHSGSYRIWVAAGNVIVSNTVMVEVR